MIDYKIVNKNVDKDDGNKKISSTLEDVDFQQDSCIETKVQASNTIQSTLMTLLKTAKADCKTGNPGGTKKGSDIICQKSLGKFTFFCRSKLLLLILRLICQYYSSWVW